MKISSHFRILIATLIITLTSFVFPHPVFADCEIASFEENTRNLTVCVGEFNSITELKNTTAEIKCLANSNFAIKSLCKGITNPSFSLANTPDSEIKQDANGKYYTCFTAQGINRAIGRLEVSFSGGTSCTTSPIITKPTDWDMATEGLPWQEGTNNPIVDDHLKCPDGKSINTALGCISTDIQSGGFVGSILELAIGLGGGIALLLILYGTFIVTTSAGNPDKLNQGKEIIGSAISGLLFIILSIVLLNLIGVKILAIPGF